MSEQPPVDRRKQVQDELRRLKLKRTQVDDRDIKAVVTQAIKDREEELIALGGPTPEAAVEPEELPPPPTDTEKADAEKLVQQARVEKMRGNSAKVAELIDQAARTAPGSSELQEMLGDELVDGRRFRDALAKYDMARRLDPKNLSADKKHADLVYKTKAGPAGLELSYLDEAENAIATKWAGIFSLVIPGAGQCMLGNWVNGLINLAISVSMTVWIIVQNQDFEQLIRTIAGRGSRPYSDAILIPIVVGVIAWIYGWGSCFARAKRERIPYFGDLTNSSPATEAVTKAKERPMPPMEGGNLPFE
jgi:hypothetical protein